MPNGWIKVPLQQCANINMGQSPEGKYVSENKDGLPFYQGKAEFGKTYPIPRKFCTKPTKIAQQNDILLSIRAPVGPTNLCPDESCIGRGLAGIRAHDGVSQQYLLKYFKHIEPWLSQQGTGSTFKAISGGFLSDVGVLIAPLNEQIRIADKLDSLLAKVDAAQARLEKIPTLLKRFRQSVLAAATSGELTREWRNTNGIGFDEWTWKKLSDIAEIQGGITKDSKKQSNDDEEVPYLRVANVQRGYLDLKEIKTIRIPKSKLDKLLLVDGDVLFNEGGDIDKLGRGWIWESQIDRCSFQNHVFRARLFDSKNHPKYVSWWGNTEGFEYFIRQGKQTTNLASINKTILCNLPINMPSPEEQTEIVRRVESLFSQADAVEKQYLAAKQRLDRLSQALLAKAFRGELVPQDPNDEPAAELLKRIQAERTTLTPTRRQRNQSS
ncbi:hypothetical protein A1356_05795 [Methylomonas koyamae]|uniref:Type I restriction modification DNA specificity domain-containing protein n=1 Tax=Methylomonas koyamae TaxID=702114 RepID=A0AA91DF25_9GAMM|nr:hypothetical protein A1356_05795 [Methylomonas koyamae]